MGREEGGRGGFATAVLRRCVYDCTAVRERDRERTRGRERERERERCSLDSQGKTGVSGDQDSEGVVRAGARVAGRVAIKYNFRGVGLIPRIPRKYFIYYLHFVVDT